jgi:ABC-2 type transport system ATP-binding protein
MEPHTSPRNASDPIDSGAVAEANALTKRYGDVTVVDGVSFRLRAGTVTGFLGPNGAGKTTTLRMLVGLSEPTAGSATVFGVRHRDLDRPAHRVGAVLESNDFHPARSGRDHLRILAALGDISPERVEQVLDLVGLGDTANGRVRTYSLGMRQRLGLAGALLGTPELLVLDEPANGLDPAGVQWLRATLRAFARGGGTVLVSSHVLAEIALSVDRVLIIHRGRLVADAALADLADDVRALETTYLLLTAGAEA